MNDIGSPDVPSGGALLASLGLRCALDVLLRYKEYLGIPWRVEFRQKYLIDQFLSSVFATSYREYD
jgi:hypothetical protein